MSLVDDMGSDGGGDDIVAAEYVLGVLPADERRQASLRIEAEQAFARLVDRWEVHFSPLAAGYAEVEAPAGVKAAVDRRLFAGGDASTAGGACGTRPALEPRLLAHPRRSSACGARPLYRPAVHQPARRSAWRAAGRFACRRRQRCPLSRRLRRTRQHHRPVARGGPTRSRPRLRALGDRGPAGPGFARRHSGGRERQAAGRRSSCAPR